MKGRTWLPFLILLLVLGAFFQLKAWVAIAAMTLVIMGVANWWLEHALDGVVYRRVWRYRRAFPGERSPIRIEVENRKLLPVTWLRTLDPWPTAAVIEDESVLAPSHIEDELLLTHLFSLRWYDRLRREYSLLFKKRGVYAVGPARLSSGDLFGMYQQSRQLENREYITVFPEVLSLPGLNLQAENPFGDLHRRRRIFEDPNQFIGVRDYRPEDGFRRVHWPATARTGALQVKIYQPVTAQVMMVCLNVATMSHYWEGYMPQLLEQLVKVTATLAYDGIQAGYAVGLVSNGCLAHADHPFRILPGRAVAQLATLLQALAAVTPFTTTPFEQYLLHSLPEVPYGSTLVVVTAILTAELSETLLRLRRYRAHTTLISLAVESPPEIPGVRSIHLPFVG